MIFTTNNTNYLIYGNRVFLLSKNINIFPCARRGPYSKEDTTEYYDPEARLNTERTNRIGTAINGFTDQFIITEPANLTRTGLFEFVLAGYRVSIKDFSVLDIEAALLGPDPAEGTAIDTIYAHLSLHPSVSLNVEGYATEILYRQIQSGKYTNYLDITDPETAASTDDFFVGISFAKEPVTDGNGTEQDHDLLLFSKDEAGSWQMEQTSLLPKVEHGETEDSIKIKGAFAIEQAGETSFEINEGGLGTVNVPLHITKATTVDGMANLSAASIYGLIVGEKAEGDIYENGTIKAKKHIETPTIEATTEVETPQLRVNRITSDEGEITVDNKKLIVNRSLEMLAKEGATTPAKATIEQAVIGDLTVKTDSKLKNSTGKVTAKEVVAEKITQNGNPVPSIKIVPLDGAYQLQFTLDASKN